MTVSRECKLRSRIWLDRPNLKVIECPNLLDELLPWHASGPLDIILRTREILLGGHDVVYAFEYQPNVSIPILIARAFRQFKLISDWCDWHSGAAYHFGGRAWAQAIDRVFEEWIRHRAHHLTVISNSLHERARRIGVPVGRITLIREGVDPQYMKPYELSTARRILGLPASGTIVGAIRDSRASHEVLVGMLRKLVPHDQSAKLMIIGRNPEGLEELVEGDGLSQRVLLPGWVSDEHLPLYLASCNVLALPLEDNLANLSRWPHKLGDMIACERPVVTSPAGEFPEMLRNRQCAIVVECDADKYSEAVLAILADQDAAKEMAHRGRRFATEELSWEIVGDQVVQVVAKVA